MLYNLLKGFSMKEIKLLDIAKKAKVSPTTVSLVLNNKWQELNISPSTQKRIIKIVEKFGYRPNILARGLKCGKTFLIGVVFSDITSGMEKIFKGIQSYFSNDGYEIILKISNSNFKEWKEAIKYIIEKKVEGIIFESSFLYNPRIRKYIKEMEMSKKIKIVFIGNEIPGFESPFIGNNNEEIGYIATKHLISHGHKKIICVTNTAYNNLIGILRVKGYKKALKEANVKVNKEFIINFFPDKYGYFEGGYLAIKKFLAEKGKIFSAIFSHGDKTALGIIKGLQEIGFKIPEDVAIVSVDNEEFSNYVYPPLTTVNLDGFKLGKFAAQILHRLLQGEKVQSILLTHKLIIRKSCGEHTNKVCSEINF